MAPELIKKELYDFKVDIWAVGIMMYMMFFEGKHPFYEKDDGKKLFYNRIKSLKDIDIPCNMAL